ncbi:MAG: hypothetical protein ABR606_02125 [Vicinamibacterales bacterium]
MSQLSMTKMRASLGLLALLVALLCVRTNLHADVLLRWDQEEVPPPAVLGVSRVVIPANNSKAVENALARGYDVYLEQAAESRVVQRQPQTASGKVNVLAVDSRGTWPHIRTNWVTRRNDVLQVTGRSAQPWLESNVALFRILQSTQPASPPILTYTWKPITLAEIDEGPALENYLIAIAEAGSVGGDLLLPLHERFEKDLLLGKPDARAAWKQIRRYLDFYSWNLPRRYRPMTSVGVVAADPMRALEAMSLLARHNIAFDLLEPARVSAERLAGLKLVISMDQTPKHPNAAAASGTPPEHPNAAAASGAPPDGQPEALAEFVRGGGQVIRKAPGGDPNQFALDVRQKLGRENRVVDIWNGLTVLTTPYEEPNGNSVLVTVVNYAQQSLPVHVRVRGAFSQVQYESPEHEAVLLPYEHRDGSTEFVIPALRVGGRVFLTRTTASR